MTPRTETIPATICPVDKGNKTWRAILITIIMTIRHLPL